MYPSWISGGGLLLRDFMVIRHGNTKIWRNKSFKDVYQVTEIVVDNAGLGQLDDIAEGTGMKINEVATAAEDRDHWRGILRAANPSYGGRH